MPDETEEDHTKESEQITTMEKENAPTRPTEMTFHHLLKVLTLVQPLVADLQVVGPVLENPNKQKHHVTHECVGERQAIYNKKMRASRVKMDNI